MENDRAAAGGDRFVTVCDDEFCPFFAQRRNDGKQLPVGGVGIDAVEQVRCAAPQRPAPREDKRDRMPSEH